MCKRSEKHCGAVRIFLAAMAFTYCFIGTASADFDPGVVMGQWATHNEKSKEADYYFLSINNDYSGILIRSFSGDSVKAEFSADDVKFHEGFLEIRLSANQKVVLSAWKLNSGKGRLSGQVFMYTKDGSLFNMLYMPLELLNDQSKILDSKSLRQLWEKYK